MPSQLAQNSPAAASTQLLTDTEVAERLRVSLRHVKALRARKLLPYICLGRAVRYRPQEIEDALTNLTIRARA